MKETSVASLLSSFVRSTIGGFFFLAASVPTVKPPTELASVGRTLLILVMEGALSVFETKTI